METVLGEVGPLYSSDYRQIFPRSHENSTLCYWTLYSIIIHFYRRVSSFCHFCVIL